MARIGVKFELNENGIYDIGFESDGKLKQDNSYDSMIISSLFSDGRADSSEISDPSRRRGWVGDSFTTLNNYKFGSKLWLLDQARMSNDTVKKAEDYTRQALDWILRLEYADRIDVSATRIPDSNISISIEIYVEKDLISKFTFTVWEDSDYGT